MPDLKRRDIKDEIAALRAAHPDLTQSEAEQLVIGRVEDDGELLLFGDFNPGRAGLEEVQVKPWWCQHIAWWHDEAADRPRPATAWHPPLVEPVIEADRLVHKGARSTLFKPGLEDCIRFNYRDASEAEARRLADYELRGDPQPKRPLPPRGWVRNLRVADAPAEVQAPIAEALPAVPEPAAPPAAALAGCIAPVARPKRKRLGYIRVLKRYIHKHIKQFVELRLTDREIADYFFEFCETMKRPPTLPDKSNRKGRVAKQIRKIIDELEAEQANVASVG
jgi:hypothetical protein